MDEQFDLKLSSNEEVEKSFDELVNNLKGRIAEDEDKSSVLSYAKFQQMRFAYAVLEYLTRGMNVTISHKVHEPFKSMGSISVEGKLLEFDNPEWFSRVSEFANSTEVYPLAKNRVRLTFTFHGLTTKTN